MVDSKGFSFRIFAGGLLCTRPTCTRIINTATIIESTNFSTAVRIANRPIWVLHLVLDLSTKLNANISIVRRTAVIYRRDARMCTRPFCSQSTIVARTESSRSVLPLCTSRARPVNFPHRHKDIMIKR